MPPVSPVRPARSGSKRASALRERRGFTLVELMVVVIILGLIGGVAVISWEALLPNQEFNSAVRQLSEVLHGTRTEAIARSREFRIYYDIDNDRYRVRTPYRIDGGFATTEDADEDRRWVDQQNLALAGVDILEVTIDDVTYQDGEVYVRFDPLGAASYHTVLLRQVLFDRDFTIEAMALTGDIRFHDGAFKREFATEKDFE